MDSHKERDLGPGHQEFGAAPTAGASGSPAVAQRGDLRFLSDCEPIPTTHHPPCTLFPCPNGVRPDPTMGQICVFTPSSCSRECPRPGFNEPLSKVWVGMSGRVIEEGIPGGYVVGSEWKNGAWSVEAGELGVGSGEWSGRI